MATPKTKPEETTGGRGKQREKPVKSEPTVAPRTGGRGKQRQR